MSNNPYQPTSGTHTSEDAPPQARPTTATVFGILNIAFGTMGLCGAVFGAVGMVFMASPMFEEIAAQTEGMELFRDASYQTFLVISMVIGSGLSVLLLASGIGLLKFKPWGRLTANYYGVAQIIYAIGNSAYQIIWIVLPMVNNGSPQAAINIASQVFGLFFSLIFPVVLLVFMNRESFVNAIRVGIQD
jgi:hypothetical protein